MLPVTGISRHDIQVTVDEQGRLAAVFSLDPGNETGPLGVGLG